LKKTIYAYIAGIIDGEGHFTIARISRPCGNGTIFHYTANMGVTNTYLPLIRHLIKVLGGAFVVSSNRAGQKKVYRWQLQANASREKALLAVIPYLREKRQQAALLLKFSRLHGQQVPDVRETLYQEMKKLHQAELVETNTSGTSEVGDVKIESDLQGDLQSEPVVTQEPKQDIGQVFADKAFMKQLVTKSPFLA